MSKMKTSAQKTPFVLAKLLLELWQVAPLDTMDTSEKFHAPLTIAELARIENYRVTWHKIPFAINNL